MNKVKQYDWTNPTQRFRAILIALLLLASTTLAACGGASSGSAKDYPTRPIQLVVPYSAGGSSDVIARTLVEEINRSGDLGKPIQVVNREGASGSIGFREVANAKPDGYTIGLGGNLAITGLPLTMETGYDYKSFDPIIGVIEDAPMLVVSGNAPWKTAQDFIKAASAKPGKFSIATAGEYTSGDVALRALEKEAKIKVKGVPFDSDGAAMTGLLGHNVEAHLASTPSVPNEQIKSGKVKPLMVFGPNRLKTHPDVPTADELGYDAVVTAYPPVVASKGLDPAIRKKLFDAFNAAAKHKAFQSMVKKNGAKSVAYSHDELLKRFAKDAKLNKSLFK